MRQTLSFFKIILIFPLIFLLVQCANKEQKENNKEESISGNSSFLDSIPINSDKYLIFNRVNEYVSKLSSEQQQSLIDAEKLILFGADSPKFRVPIDSITFKNNLRRVPLTLSQSGDTTKFVRAELPIVDNTITDLKNSPKGKNIFHLDALFGMKIYVFKIDYDDGKNLVEAWSKDPNKNNSSHYTPTFTKLLNDYSNDTTQLINEFYVGRLSIMAQLTYNEKSIKTEKYIRIGDGTKIKTQFNVGRLCPPKCPPDQEI